MNVSCGGSTIMTSGRWSRSANTPHTLQRPMDGHASKGGMSSTSTPTSPNYFDMLSEEEDRPEIVPQPTTKSQNAGKTVKVAERPHANRLRNTPVTTTTTTSAPPPRLTKQNNLQHQQMQPSIEDPVQPLVARALVHGAPTLQQPPLARSPPPQQRGKQTPFSRPSSTATWTLMPLEH
jgi:DNA-binding transcriptional regulator of glucitol operon